MGRGKGKKGEEKKKNGKIRREKKEKKEWYGENGRKSTENKNKT